MPEPAIDLVFLTGLAREIGGECVGRTARLYRHPDQPLCLLDAGGDRSWCADLTPGRGSLRRNRLDNPDEWRPWGGRRTDGAQVMDVAARGGDRVLCVRLFWQSRLGDSERTDLVWEFGGRQTNAVLLTGEDVIVDVLRPVSGRISRVREVLPGRVYVPPPTFERMRADRVWSWDGIPEDETIRDFLTGRFLAMSRLWAGELCARSGIELATPVRSLDAAARRRLESHAAEMCLHPQPCIILDNAGEPTDHAGFRPIHLPSERIRPVETFAEAIDAVWTRGDHSADEDRQRRRREHEMRRERRRLERQRDRLLDDLARAERADEHSHLADLIMAHLHTIPPGAEEVTFTDWLDPDQRDVVVRLDPRQSPPQEAERLYRRARKLRDGIAHIRRRLARTARALERMAAAEETSVGDRQLPARAQGTNVSSHQGNRTGDRPEVRLRRYRTREGGWLVLVGKTDRDNDELSLKIASQNDFWFHAHGCSGSHVVLKLEGRKDMPSRQALAEAAAVAAYWSKARGASKVGVSYTRAKYVNKPKGAKPGTVAIRHEKLLTVPPALSPFADEASSAGDGTGIV